MTIATSKNDTNIGDPLVDRLGALETGQLSDVLEEAGLPYQVVSSSLAPLRPGQRIVGRAACARGEPAGLGSKAASGVFEDIMKPGAILVIEAAGYTETSCTGGIVIQSLRRFGCGGLVTDGAIRDADELVAMEFSCFAAAVNPIAGRKIWRLVELNGTVTLPGQRGTPVSISPGDIILADGDGIVVVPQAAAQQIVEDAETLQAIEGRISDELAAGASRAQAFERNPRFAHIRKL